MRRHRNPYVGAGADGARRSAQIDLEERDTLDAADPRRELLADSAADWLEQARELDVDEIGRRICRYCGEPIDVAPGDDIHELEREVGAHAVCSPRGNGGAGA